MKESAKTVIEPHTPISYFQNNPFFLFSLISNLIIIILLIIFINIQYKTSQDLSSSLVTLKKNHTVINEEYLHLINVSFELSENTSSYHNTIKDFSKLIQQYNADITSYTTSSQLLNISIQHITNEINLKTVILKSVQEEYIQLQMLFNSKRLEEIDSAILHSSEEVYFLEQEANMKIIKVIYSSERDGLSTGSFHSICNDEIKPTFTLYQTGNGARFGGFTKQSFQGNDQYKYDDEAFMFNLNQKTIYPILNKRCAIHTDKQFFPSFDGDALFIDFTNHGYALLDKLHGMTEGMSKFTIEKIEVLLASQT